MTHEAPVTSDISRSQLFQILKSFIGSDVGKKAAFLLITLFLLLIGVNGLNVVNSYVGRDFITALAERNTDGFMHQAVLYLGVFTLSTVVAVFFRYTEERLGLLWREWLTKLLISNFLKERTYFRLKEARGLENPDERIAEDVKSFTVTTLSFMLLILNGSITVLAFSGVIWSISPMLFGVTVIYAVAGSFLAVKLGRPLIGLNYSQLDKEANFRASLIHLWENAESVALSQREERLQTRLLQRVAEVMNNGYRIIAVNRNLGFFTTGYNYMIQILPALVVAPLYLRGEAEFGVITQSAMAFAHLVGAFSLIVNQFQSISSFAAVIARLGLMGQVIEQSKSDSTAAIRIEPGDDGLIFQNLTLCEQTGGPALIADLTMTVERNGRVAVAGGGDAAKEMLLKATAGIWNHGSGTIVRPPSDQVLFLPERPYLPPGNLREVLLCSPQTGGDRIDATLDALGLDGLIARIGGLDSERDWATTLSLAEQQLVAIAHVLLARPKFVFLLRATSALNDEQTRRVFEQLRRASIGYIGAVNVDQYRECFDHILELAQDGSWRYR